jgi:predicted acetyltransferase
MTGTELPIRVGTPDDWSTISNLLFAAFHSTMDQEASDLDGAIWEPERALVATDGDTIVGHAAAFTRDLSVPGNVLPAAHVTMVAVAPTHRRRGLLNRMMRQQLRDVTEPIAVLWASESRIYSRFGYGLAAHRLEMDIESAEVQLPAATSPAKLRAGTPAALQPELAKVYDQVRADRPGWSSRGEATWAYVLGDTAWHRAGNTELRAVVHEGIGGIDGYALWRTRGSWTGGSNPNGEVQVREVAAANLDAYLALWRFLFGIDLTRTVHYGFAAVDEPLLHLASDPRRLNSRYSDSLWVRVVDVGAALAARRYIAPVDVVFEVSDALLPENAGRWRLTATPDRAATCTRTEDPADLACDVRDLGAAYLGGPTLSALAAAGRVRELTPGALATASLAFGWHRAPASPEVF